MRGRFGMQKKKELLEIADQLYTLGLQVERERAYLKSLVLAGVPYESEEMLRALITFQTLEKSWKQLEADYLSLRQEIERKSHPQTEE